MSGDTELTNQEGNQEKELIFKCKFCGETRPYKDLVVLRQYYPQLSACKTCAAGATRCEDQETEPAE